MLNVAKYSHTVKVSTVHIFVVHFLRKLILLISKDKLIKSDNTDFYIHAQMICALHLTHQKCTHSSEHTPGAVGSHLCHGARGVVWGSVPCSRATQSWY